MFTESAARARDTCLELCVNKEANMPSLALLIAGLQSRKHAQANAQIEKIHGEHYPGANLHFGCTGLKHVCLKPGEISHDYF